MTARLVGLGQEAAEAFQTLIIDEGKLGAFVVLAAFVLTFVFIRLVTHAVRRGRWRARDLHIANTHVHHLVPGVVLLLVSGYLAFAFGYDDNVVVATLYGVGAALTLDEFALWLHLRDVYWEREGRRSVEVVLAAAGLGALVVLGLDFWQALLTALVRVAGWV